MHDGKSAAIFRHNKKMKFPSASHAIQDNTNKSNVHRIEKDIFKYRIENSTYLCFKYI